MRKQFATLSSLFVIFAFSIVMSPVFGAKKNTEEVSEATQTAMCEAQCREDHQDNQAATSGCLKNCGAPEPASATTVKSSKSNSSERSTVPAEPLPEPAETSNLNLSKSNVDRNTGQETIACSSTLKVDCD